MNTTRNSRTPCTLMAFALLAAMALRASGATPAVAEAIARYRVEEAPRAQRENPTWHRPSKVLLLGNRNPALAAQAEAFAAAAPGARIVVAGDANAAATEAIDADVIIGNNPDICDARTLGAARKLRWVASLSAGVENCLAVPALRDPDLLITNMRGVDAPAIAEHAVALLLALAHGLDAFAADTARGQWSPRSAGVVTMQMLDGKTLLVVGLGGIGTEVAQRAHGLGMRVIATREGGRGKPDFVDYVGQPGELLVLAARADAIVSAVPLTPQTTGLYDAQFFSVLKPQALFVNVARGGSVDTGALVTALTAHRRGGAGLDVVDPEPLPPDHPLWQAPRVLVTPHISSRSDLPGEARWTLATENLRRYARGDKMLLVVDPRRGY